jgi:hypothetical protein
MTSKSSSAKLMLFFCTKSRTSEEVPLLNVFFPTFHSYVWWPHVLLSYPSLSNDFFHVEYHCVSQSSLCIARNTWWCSSSSLGWGWGTFKDYGNAKACWDGIIGMPKRVVLPSSEYKLLLVCQVFQTTLLRLFLSTHSRRKSSDKPSSKKTYQFECCVPFRGATFIKTKSHLRDDNVLFMTLSED